MGISASGSLVGLEFSVFDDTGASGSHRGTATEGGDSVSTGGFSEHDSFATGFISIVNGTANAVTLRSYLEWALDLTASAKTVRFSDALGSSSGSTL